LIAVQTLSVNVPAPVALDILEGRLGARLSGLLQAIPRDIDMVDADAVVVADGSPADRAWGLLCEQYGVNWVIAGKVLARKRPRLLPVYDRVVRCAIGRPPSFWLALHAVLREDGAALHRQLLEQAGCRAARNGERVAGVRCGEWMSHRAVVPSLPLNACRQRDPRGRSGV
jgi:hypothetical protein